MVLGADPSWDVDLGIPLSVSLSAIDQPIRIGHSRGSPGCDAIWDVDECGWTMQMLQ